MIINPQEAINNDWVRGIHNPQKQIQPNAIDFTLDKLYAINTTEQFTISELGKAMRGNVEMVPVEDRRYKHETGESVKFWHFRNEIYDGMSDMYVDLPEGVAAMLVTRSTFSRNGVFIMSGLYDSGFKGHIGFLVHNRASGVNAVGQGTRIGQVMFIASDSAGMYKGGWNHEQGTHYTEKDGDVGPMREDSDG